MLRKFLWYHDAHQKRTFKKLWGIENLSVLFRFKKEEDYVTSVKLASEIFENPEMFIFWYQPPFETPEKIGRLIAPNPNSGIFTDELTRAGLPPVSLYKPE